MKRFQSGNSRKAGSGQPQGVGNDRPNVVIAGGRTSHRGQKEHQEGTRRRKSQLRMNDEYEEPAPLVWLKEDAHFYFSV